MLTIDGSFGEGGGQILRTSLSLSMITGIPFHIHSIRAGRKRPGLKAQHLTAVRAAQTISNAVVTGDYLGSKRVTFTPGTVSAGEYQFNIGTAGSTMLLFQTLFPALYLQKSQSTLLISGGTHALMAPPVEFIRDTFLKTINAKCDVELLRYGYFPRGGGAVRVKIEPGIFPVLNLTRPTSSATFTISITSVRTSEEHVQLQEQELIRQFPNTSVTLIKAPSVGPGSHCTITVTKGHIETVFVGIAKRNRSAQITAKVASEKAKKFAESSILCNSYLSDQLMIPMALAGNGTIACNQPSLHVITNAEVIKMFTGKTFDFCEESDEEWECSIC